ncbi:MAG: phosphopyruvate hydratase [Trueperaceae bacterium]|nr:MAG: phosphopyruvate hydratase [Trueperaceae bacterium]
MPTIRSLSALEILDSRGRPTVKTTVELDSGAFGAASVPSGASTGRSEALELRDADPKRYQGLGCLRAVANVNGELNDSLAGRSFDQAALDRTMIELDGTASKARFGANALLSVSLAFARAVAAERKAPLYRQFAGIAGLTPRTLPRPTINLFSGGKHAGGQVPIQDVLIVPAAARTIAEVLELAYAVYRAAADLAKRRYGVRELTADEGGLAPPFASVEAMLQDAVGAIEAAGLRPGTDVALALDVASSHFYHRDGYHLGERKLDGSGMIAFLADLVERYPVVSLEDGLAEDDWSHWPQLHERLAGRTLILGDDLLCTNPERIRRAVSARAADALLLKVNQVGTLTEAAEAASLARAAGWQVTVSARSGETEDDWLADLSVGWNGDQIKVGSITQSERLAKYNRLLEIDRETGLGLVTWPQKAGNG